MLRNKNSTSPEIPCYVRHYQGRLPMTGKVIGVDKAMSGRALYRVNVFGYSLSKVEYWLVDQCEDYQPSDFMLGQLNQWLLMASV